ncbi:MAG: HigA family addiction module antidote protein [Bacteroidales bacterium]|nr:HigA family addiction module antidote protein [Clostridiaceae bacterium]NLI99764.1 HigA family addiction module antidote protein [Bacteroidales bacterium]
MLTLENIKSNMIANNLTSFAPTHPGEILKEEIEFRGLSQRGLAKKMGVSHTVFNEILNAKRPLTVEIALLVEAALGVDAEPLIGMQTRYNIQVAKSNETFSERLKNLRRVCATAAL